ncbi:MAG: hypothetical protein K1000chlam3_00786 [Chlamydiae bacterium]|nr:hypothetical protein [Chlamydiota bacterium]
MSYAIQSPSLLPISFQEAGKQAGPAMGSRIKNLFGRVFTNWKDSIIVAGVVFWVTKAAVSFFTGFWMMSIFELFTGGFLAMMRKDYRDFTNLHKTTGELHRGVGKLRETNLQLQLNVKDFQEENKLLTATRKKFGEENKRFAFSNTRLEKEIGTMSEVLGASIGKIENAHAFGKDMVLEVLGDAKKQLESQRKATAQIQKEVIKKQDEALNRWGQIVKQVGEMKAHGVDVLNEANKSLQVTLREIGKYQAVKLELEDQITRLRATVSTIEKASDYNLDTAKKANRAASAINLFYKGICSSDDPQASQQFNKIIGGLGIVSFVAYKTFAAAAAA